MPDPENDLAFLQRKEIRLSNELSRVRRKIAKLEEAIAGATQSQPEKPCADHNEEPEEPQVDEETTEPETSGRKKSKRKSKVKEE